MSDVVKHISAVQSLLSIKTIASPVDAVGQEIIRDLNEWIVKDLIEVRLQNEEFFNLLEKKFPISVNRIDWSRVNPHREVFFFSGKVEVKCAERQDALAAFRDTLKKWLSEVGTRDSDVITFVGDDSEVAVRMTIDTFLKCYPVLLVQPQHGYVLPADGSWCLNYTMESDLFLGKSSDAIATGCLDEPIPE